MLWKIRAPQVSLCYKSFQGRGGGGKAEAEQAFISSYTCLKGTLNTSIGIPGLSLLRVFGTVLTFVDHFDLALRIGAAYALGFVHFSDFLGGSFISGDGGGVVLLVLGL